MLTNVCLVKAMVLPVVMYGVDSWSKKKAEHQRIDGSKLQCWRRLLKLPWTTRRSNQSILKEISHEYSLEALILNVKLQYFGHLLWRADPLEKSLMLRKIEDSSRRGWQKMRWLDGIIDSRGMSLSKLLEILKGGGPGMLQSMGSRRIGHDWVTEEQQQGLTTSLELTQMNSFLWLSTIPLYIDTTTSLTSHLLMDI